jgi:hypothetical protein
MAGQQRGESTAMAIFTVTNTNDAGAGSLRQAILDANTLGAPGGVPSGGNAIVFASGLTGTIALASDLPLIHSNLAIEGAPGVTIDGGGAHRAFFVSGLATTGNGVPPAITVSISDLVVRNVRAQGGHGGDGGGGGLGAGGGLFVNQNAHVTIANVTFDGASATGGNGGTGVGSLAGGGGGGLGGDGGFAFEGGAADGGGGGGGLYFAGGSAGSTGGSGGGGGITSVGADGGGGVGGNGGLGAKGVGGGGGGGGGSSSAGTGGGAGAAAGSAAAGGNGGFGGGGGGGSSTAGNGGFGGGGGGTTGSGPDAGDGGFGGGGGGADSSGVHAGSGGFGGGGGGDFSNTLAAGGFGGGSGRGSAGSVTGGGGAGMGGAVFVVAGGSLSINGNGGVAGGAVSGGTSSTGGTAGLAFGSGFFLQATTVVFGDGDYTVADDIADQNGSGGAAASNGVGGTGGSGGITKDGTGTLTLAGSNTYTGATIVKDGTLLVSGSIAGSTTEVLSGGTFGGDGVTGRIDVATGGTLSPGASAGALETGTIVLFGGANLDIELGGTTAGAQYDQLRVTGLVELTGANLNVSPLAFVPTTGTAFTIIDNDGSDGVFGQFAQGTQFTTNGHSYAVNYAGGDGNDVVLTALNDAPIIGSNGGGATANVVVAENTRAVTTVHATDVDSASLAYSIVGGADMARFTINAATGVLSFIRAPDFEAPTDADHNNSYVVQVRASDGSLFDNQTITVNVRNLAPLILGSNAANALIGTIEEDTIRGLGGNDRLRGLGGNDVIDGGGGHDFLDGGAGLDRLFGNTGNDRLIGGLDNDILTGRTGRDIMTGGAGADDFDFNVVWETGKTAPTRDIIADFVHGADDIDLSTIDANGSAAGNGAFRFLVREGAAFTGVRGQLRFDQQVNKTIVEGDVNGDGNADFQIQLTGLKTLTAGDFVL